MNKANTNLPLKRPQSNGNTHQATEKIIVALQTIRTRKENHRVVMIEKGLRGGVLTILGGTHHVWPSYTSDVAGPNCDGL